MPTAGVTVLPLLDAASCCTPLTTQPLDAPQAEALAQVLKALAEPTRLRLLSLVAAHEGGEACVCDLTDAVGLAQPTVSHHLKILVDAGLLTRDKRSVWAYYALVPHALDAVAALLTSPGIAIRSPSRPGTSAQR
jgi:ArsR family transcriptional regulator